MSYIDVSGKTVEEALAKALTQLQMDRDDVSVRVPVSYTHLTLPTKQRV